MSTIAAETREIAPRGTRPAKFAHIVLRTSNFEPMLAFYRTFLQADAAFENPMIAFLRYDDEHHRLVIVNIPPLPPQTDLRCGLEHFSYTYDSLGDLLGQYLFLKSRGIAPAWCINHGFTTSIYYNDPDGNQIETQVDSLDVAAADAYMRGPYFAQNPIGVDFDPDALVERYRRGDPLEELLRQGSAPLADGANRPHPQHVPPYDWKGELLPA